MVDNNLTPKDAYAYIRETYVGRKDVTISEVFMDLSQNGLSGLLTEYTIKKRLDDLGCRAPPQRGRGPIANSKTISAASVQKTEGKKIKGWDKYALS